MYGQNVPIGMRTASADVFTCGADCPADIGWVSERKRVALTRGCLRVGCGRSSNAVHGAWSLLQSDARNAHDRHPSMRASASDYSAKAARKPRPEGQNCTRRHAPSMPPYVQLVQFASFMHQTRQKALLTCHSPTRSTRTAHTSCTIVRYDCAGNLWHGGCG
jgi:hypothetical protein